jgi:mono/diheme cytochrome c family protein
MIARLLPLTVCLACGDRIERILAKDGDPTEGSAVWNVHCVECHAADGTGTEEGPDLTDEPEPLDEVAEKILYGWGEMEGFAHELSNRQMADLLAYLEDEVIP